MSPEDPPAEAASPRSDATASGAGRSARFSELLYRVLEAAEAERSRLLAQCDDPELRARVRLLLAEEGKLGSFLDLGTGGHTIGSLIGRLPPLERSSAPAPPLTPVSLGQIRRRLERLGRSASLVVAAAILAFAGLGVISPRLLLDGPWPHVGATFAALWLLSLALRVVSAGSAVSDRTVLVLGHLYLIAVSGLAGYFHATHELYRLGQVTPFGPFILPIALLPLVLSTGTGATLVSGFAASLAALGGVFAAEQVAAAELGARAYLELALIAPGAGLVIAVVLSRNMSHLRAEIAEIRNLGSYRLEEKIGRGGMGEVWRASHQLLARPAAVKLVRADRLASAEGAQTVRERFIREARAIAALGSPHTVRLYDFGVTADGLFFIAMELLDGIDLQALVTRFGAQPGGRVRSILLQVCDSLAEAHELGLVHRDVKPANVMLCRQGRRLDVAKVLDFGVVTATATAGGSALSHNPLLTVAGGVLGTPAFAAPEVLGGNGADPRSDLYSLGCVAYWLLTGRLVFDHHSPLQQIAAHLRDDPVPLAARGVGAAADLESAVMQCLAKDPRQRPSSASDLAARLAAGAAGDDWAPERAQAWWARHLPPSAP